MSDPTVNYIILALAFCFEGAALYFAVREFNKSRKGTRTLAAVRDGKDPTLFVVLFEDSAAMLGLLIAAGGIALAQMTGDPVWDGAASVLIGVVLASTAFWLAYETKGLLIGESAHPDIVASITRMLEKHASINHVNEVLTLHMGPEFILVTITADFENTMTVGTIESDVDTLAKQIKSKHPLVKRVFIEAEAKA